MHFSGLQLLFLVSVLQIHLDYVIVTRVHQLQKKQLYLHWGLLYVLNAWVMQPSLQEVLKKQMEKHLVSELMLQTIWILHCGDQMMTMAYVISQENIAVQTQLLHAEICLLFCQTMAVLEVVLLLSQHDHLSLVNHLFENERSVEKRRNRFLHCKYPLPVHLKSKINQSYV